jgi:hypothetical protein
MSDFSVVDSDLLLSYRDPIWDAISDKLSTVLKNKQDTFRARKATCYLESSHKNTGPLRWLSVQQKKDLQKVINIQATSYMSTYEKRIVHSFYSNAINIFLFICSIISAVIIICLGDAKLWVIPFLCWILVYVSTFVFHCLENRINRRLSPLLERWINVEFSETNSTYNHELQTWTIEYFPKQCGVCSNTNIPGNLMYCTQCGHVVEKTLSDKQKSYDCVVCSQDLLQGDNSTHVEISEKRIDQLFYCGHCGEHVSKKDREKMKRFFVEQQQQQQQQQQQNKMEL